MQLILLRPILKPVRQTPEGAAETMMMMMINMMMDKTSPGPQDTPVIVSNPQHSWVILGHKCTRGLLLGYRAPGHSEHCFYTRIAEQDVLSAQGGRDQKTGRDGVPGPRQNQMVTVTCFS